MKTKMREALRRVASGVKRHPKKTAGAGIGAAGLIWIAVGLWTTYELNRLTFEKRFERAQRDIAGGPRQEVYNLVLEHEALVRSLAARGSVAQPLFQVDGGVVDPLMQEILRPTTLAEKVRIKRRTAHDPESVAALLEQRNAGLRSQLDGGTASSLVTESEALRTASNAPPDSTLELNRGARSPQPVRVRSGQSLQSLQAADQIKALCAARGDSVKELGNTCEDPELVVTRVASAQAP